MSRSNWWSFWQANHARRRSHSSSPRRLAVEWLEDRLVPTVSSLDDIANTFAQARLVSLSEDDSAVALGSIDYVGDVDFFRVVANSSGSYLARMLATDRSSDRVDSQISVFNADFSLLARNDDSGESNDSQTTFRMEAGQTYYLQATASPFDANYESTRSRSYLVLLTPYGDDVGNTPELAQSLPLSGSQTGNIEVAGDVDVYRLVATRTGGLNVRVGAAQGSTLDSFVTVLDEDGNVLAQGDNDGEGLTAQAVAHVTANRTYYLRVSGSPFALQAISQGAYTLQSSYFADAEGNTFADAQRVDLFFGSAEIRGRVDAVGDVDAFRFVAQHTGGVAILPMSGSGAVSLSAHNQGTELLARGPQGRLTFSVVAGQSYTLLVAGQVGAPLTSNYFLQLRSFADDAGDRASSATALTLTTDDSLVRTGRFEQQGDTDVYSFQAVSSGEFVIQVEMLNGATAGTLTLQDSAGTQLTRDSNLAELSSTRVIDELSAGQTYFVRLENSLVGDYRLSLATYQDDVGDDFDTATFVEIPAAGTILTGEIGAEGDRDLFEFVAPETGEFVIVQEAPAGSVLDTFVAVFDGDEQELAANDDFGGNLNSQVTVSFLAGETYYLSAGAFQDSTGAYRLIVRPYVAPVGGSGSTSQTDEFGDTFSTAHDLVAEPPITVTGAIQTAGDIDLFRFVAPTAGQFLVSQNSFNSNLDSLISVLSATGQEIVSDDQSGGNNNALLSFAAVEGETYFLQAGGYLTSFGAYELTIQLLTDDVGNSPETALTLDFGQQETLIQTGSIETRRDVDLYRFVAPFSGPLSIRQVSATGSRLDSLLQVFDADLATGSPAIPLATNDDADSTLNSRLSVNVVEGETYFIQAGAFGTTTGAYELRVARLLDDVGDTNESAKSLSFGADDSAQQRGQIEVADDVDRFVFVAPITGSFILTQRAAASRVIGNLSILDADGNRLEDSMSQTNVANRLVLSVTEGETYYIDASSALRTTGTYQLSLTPYVDDASNHRELATSLDDSLPGLLGHQGNIEVAGDIDWYRFTAERTETVAVRVRGLGPTFLDSDLQVVDADGIEIAFNANQDGTPNPRVQFRVTEGTEYFLRVRGDLRSVAGLSTGRYSLSISPSTQGDDFGNDNFFEFAHELPASAWTTGLNAELGTAGDTDLFQFTATTTESVVVTLNAAEGSSLDPSLFIFDQRFRGVTYNYNSNGTRNSEVTFNTVAGETYFVWATAFGSTPSTNRGHYVLTLRPGMAYQDDVGQDGDTLGTLTSDETGAAETSGTLEVAHDRDRFRFVAAETGSYLITVLGDPSTTLQGSVRIFAATGSQLAPMGQWTQASRITIDLEAGETYEVEVGSAYGLSQGSYALSVVPYVDDHGDSFDEATPYLISPDMPLVLPGLIGSASDNDFFQLTTTGTGDLVVRQDPGPHGPLEAGLDTWLRLYDENWFRIASDYDSTGNLGSQVTIDAQASDTFIARVRNANTSSTGAYVFSARLRPDVGDSLESAQELDLPSMGTTAIEGYIGSGGDVDVYAFLAPVTGSLVIQQSATNASGLDSFLSVLDADGIELDFNDDFNGLDSQVTIQVVAGQLYYAVAGSFGLDTGEYLLRFLPLGDDFGDTRDNSHSISLVNNDLLQRGSIFQSSDVDVFSFVAPSTGLLVLHQDATRDSELDSFLTVTDAIGTVLARNDDSFSGRSFTLDSVVNVPVVAGQTYFIRAASSPDAASFGDEVGSYVLIGRLIEQLSLSQDGTAIQAGTLISADDENLYEFVATQTGGLELEMRASSGSSLDTMVSLLDSRMRPIAQNNDSDGSTNSRLIANVVAGQVYYVRAQSFVQAEDSNRQGNFLLELRTGQVQYGIGNTSAVAQTLTLNEGNLILEFGTLEVPGDQNIYTFTANASGPLAIRSLAEVGDLQLSMYLFDSSNQLVSQTNSRSSELNANVEEGETYTLRVMAAPGTPLGQDVGDYAFTILPDDLGGGSGGVVVSPGSGANQTGTVNGGNDVDTFQIVTQAAGAFLLDLSGLGARVSGNVSVFDSNGVLLTSGINTVSTTVSAGQNLFVQLSAFSGDSGAKYEVDLSVTAIDQPASSLPSPGFLGNLLTDSLETQLGGDGDNFTFGGNSALAGGGLPGRDLIRGLVGIDPLANANTLSAQTAGTLGVTELAAMSDSELALVAVFLVAGAIDTEAVEVDASAGETPVTPSGLELLRPTEQAPVEESSLLRLFNLVQASMPPISQDSLGLLAAETAMETVLDAVTAPVVASVEVTAKAIGESATPIKQWVLQTAGTLESVIRGGQSRGGKATAPTRNFRDLILPDPTEPQLPQDPTPQLPPAKDESPENPEEQEQHSSINAFMVLCASSLFFSQPRERNRQRQLFPV